MYGDIQVTLMKTEEFANHVTHIFQIKKVKTISEWPSSHDVTFFVWLYIEKTLARHRA